MNMNNGYEYMFWKIRNSEMEDDVFARMSLGWEPVMTCRLNNWESNVLFKRPKQTLNADIRNKLGPLQTIMDLVNTWGLKNPSNMDDDVITQVFNEAIEEANKSMEYLKHIGE